MIRPLQGWQFSETVPTQPAYESAACIAFKTKDRSVIKPLVMFLAAEYCVSLFEKSGCYGKSADFITGTPINFTLLDKARSMRLCFNPGENETVVDTGRSPPRFHRKNFTRPGASTRRTGWFNKFYRTTPQPSTRGYFYDPDDPRFFEREKRSPKLKEKSHTSLWKTIFNSFT